jgi:hypothetical protein
MFWIHEDSIRREKKHAEAQAKAKRQKKLQKKKT